MRGREEAIGLQEFPAMEIVLEWHRDVRGAQPMEPSLAKKGGKKGYFYPGRKQFRLGGSEGGARIKWGGRSSRKAPTQSWVTEQ